jgi:hypothetical protein
MMKTKLQGIQHMFTTAREGGCILGSERQNFIAGFLMYYRYTRLQVFILLF